MNTEVPKRRRTDSSDTDSFHKVDMAYADNSDLQSDYIDSEEEEVGDVPTSNSQDETPIQQGTSANSNVIPNRGLKRNKILLNKRGVVAVSFVFAFLLTLFFFVSIQKMEHVDQLNKCNVEREKLAKVAQFLSVEGEFDIDNMPETEVEAMTNLMNNQNLYVGRCKKVSLKPLEKLGLINSGNIIICI